MDPDHIPGVPSSGSILSIRWVRGFGLPGFRLPSVDVGLGRFVSFFVSFLVRQSNGRQGYGRGCSGSIASFRSHELLKPGSGAVEILHERTLGEVAKMSHCCS